MCKPAREVITALDQVEEIQSALRGFDDLMTPDMAIDGKARDNVALLHSFLVRQHEAATAALRAALFGGASC